MKNSKEINIDVSKSRSNSPEKQTKANNSRELTTNSTAWTGFKSGEVFSKQGILRKLTGISRAKYTDINASRFEGASESPTKTDKSLILYDNIRSNKNTDLKEVQKILEKIDQTEHQNSNSYIRRRRNEGKPVITIENTETKHTKASILDQNHPMNLSVSSLNSVSKSRDSKLCVTRSLKKVRKDNSSILSKSNNESKSRSPIGKI